MVAINHRTYRTLANAKTWDGAVLTGGETIRLADNVNIKTYVLIPVSSETPDDFLYFAPTSNPGTKMWHLVTPQGAMSHVYASSDAGTQAIANNTWTTVVFEDEIEDILSEYNPATGIFTATYAGYYNTSFGVWLADVSWSVGEYCVARININSSVFKAGARSYAPAASALMGAMVSGGGYLTAGQTIECQVQHSQGASVNLLNNSSLTWVTIDRLI